MKICILYYNKWWKWRLRTTYRRKSTFKPVWRKHEIKPPSNIMKNQRQRFLLQFSERCPLCYVKLLKINWKASWYTQVIFVIFKHLRRGITFNRLNFKANCIVPTVLYVDSALIHTADSIVILTAFIRRIYF